MALAYAAYAHRKGKVFQCITEESLQERYLLTPIEELANIMSGESLDARVMRAAQRFEQEHTLHQWIEVQNVQKGLAPSSARILIEAERLKHRTHGGISLQRPGISDVGKTKWMQRFKQRWNVRQGKFQAGECVPQKDAHAKARTTQKTPRGSDFRGPAIQGRTKKGGQKTVPKSGPSGIISFTSGTGKRPPFLNARAEIADFSRNCERGASAQKH